jgi:hypothetical protein
MAAPALLNPVLITCSISLTAVGKLATLVRLIVVPGLIYHSHWSNPYKTTKAGIDLLVKGVWHPPMPNSE